MEKYSAVSCPGCRSFEVQRQAECTKIIENGELVKEATANVGEVYRCLKCRSEFTLPVGPSSSGEKSG